MLLAFYNNRDWLNSNIVVDLEHFIIIYLRLRRVTMNVLLN